MKVSEKEREDALEQLRELIKPGDTVRTILRHRSASGMTRWISPVVITADGARDVSWQAGRVLGWPVQTRGHDGIEVGGCGMDMGFHLVYSLSRDLYPEYPCLDPEHESNTTRCARCGRVLVQDDGRVFWRTTGFHGEYTCYGKGDGDMSYGNHLPGHRLSYGAKCPSNYHGNGGETGGEPVHHDGYAISQRWL
jgi:hypothetical protein